MKDDNFLDSPLRRGKKTKLKDIKVEKRIYKCVDMFYIFFIIWLVDFMTTILALNLPALEGKLVELNPIVNWFHSFGFIGWVGAFFYSVMGIFLLSFFVTTLINYLKNETLKHNIWILVIGIIVMVETIAILNNIWWMLS